MTKHIKQLPVIFLAAALSITITLALMPSVPYAARLGGSISKNKVAREVVSLDEEHQIESVAFSPDGKYLIAAPYYYSTTTHIWDWQSRTRLASPFQNQRINPLATHSIQYSPDGRTVVSCGLETRAWKTDKADVLFVSEKNHRVGQCQSMDFFPDGKSIAIALVSHTNRLTTLAVRDTSTGQLLWEVINKGFFAKSMAVSPDARFIALGGMFIDEGNVIHEQVRIIDAAQRAIVRIIEAVPSVHRDSHKNTDGSVSQVAWSADSLHIAVGLSGVPFDGAAAVKIVDAASGEIINSEAAPMGTRIQGLCYSPDGKYLVELGIGKSVRIWDGRHERLLQEIPGKPQSCAISKDGRYLALSGGAPGIGSINGWLSLLFPGKGRILVYELK